MCRRSWLAILLLLCPQIATADALHPAPGDRLFLRDLGPGVIPTAINDNGEVAGQDANGVAFKWTNGVFTPLGTLGGTQSYANDINNAGTVVGWALDGAGKKKAFKYTTSITNLDSTTDFEGTAEAINNRDEIVGWREKHGVFGSVLWDKFRPNGRFLFDESNHIATGINDFGTVVGINLEDDGEPKEGYFWNTSKSIGEIISEIGSSYYPYGGINNNDVSAGEEFKSAEFYKLGDGLSTSIPLVNPVGHYSRALAINNNDIIVGQSDHKGFMFDLATRTIFLVNDFPFATPGFEFVMDINDINDNGQFVATAWTSNGSHGVIGQLSAVPEPATIWMTVVGLIAFVICILSKRIETKGISPTTL